MKEKILVTGATGYTGKALSTALLKKNYDVKVLVRKASNYLDLKELGCEIYFGDLATGEGLEKAVKGVSKVYHIGAAFRVEGVPKKYFWNVHVEGTRILLDASLKYGIKRFVHCSTIGVQGGIKNPPATEDAPFNAGDHYQESKLDGERLALSYVNKGLGVVVCRPVGIYGPGEKRFVKLFKPISKGKWFVVGNAEKLFHLVYIDDLVKGIMLCGEVEGIEGEVFTLGGEEYCSLGELGLRIAKCLGVKLEIYHLPVVPVWLAAFLCEIVCRFIKIEPPIFRRRLGFFLKDRAFDISKARNILNYNPIVSLDEGIRKTADWYKKKGIIS